MKNRYIYPVQMASIKRGDWRMQELMDKGTSLPRMRLEQHKLWKQVKKIADNAKKPPYKNKFFPGSQLIGHSWEWAVYVLPSKKEVVKVPANVFLEVNEPEYLSNTKDAYEVCKKYFKPFVVNTSFKRIKYDGKFINTIRQGRLQGKEIYFIDADKTDDKLKRSLITFSEGILELLETHDWKPDMHLRRKTKAGKRGWNIWNMIIENNEPRIFDFTAYYDVFRLSPSRTKREVRIKGNNWRRFLKELKK